MSVRIADSAKPEPALADVTTLAILDERAPAADTLDQRRVDFGAIRDKRTGMVVIADTAQTTITVRDAFTICCFR